MAEITVNPTRRSILGATAMMAVAAMPASAAISAPPSRRAWNVAMANLEKVRRDGAPLHAAAIKASEAYEAHCPDEDALDLREFGHIGHRRAFLFSADLDGHYKRFADSYGKTWHAVDADAALTKRRAAIDAVLDWRRREKAVRTEFNVDTLSDQSDAYGDLESDAEGVLIGMPAPDRAALKWKLDLLFFDSIAKGNTNQCWSAEYLEQTMADVRRLLGDA